MLIFTDLDGTLLDKKTYGFAAARKALELCKKKNIPIILCSSKDFAEMTFLQKKLGIRYPFIVEDGGGIYFEKNYFSKPMGILRGNHECIVLGESYKRLVLALKQLRENGLQVRGFSDMDAKEVSQRTGLTIEAAKRAKLREFDEAFVFEGDTSHLEREVKKLGLFLTKGGRFYHLIGNSNKGDAVKKLAKIFEDNNTIGIGDSQNDFSMLDAVKRACLVRRSDGTYASNKYEKAKGVGPHGWNEFILKVVGENYESI